MDTTVGTMVKDPEIRYDRTGHAHATLLVRVNGDDEPTTLHVVGDLAENVALSLTKGMDVLAVGSLNHVVYTAEDGRTVTVPELTVVAIGPNLRRATVDVHRVVGHATGVRLADDDPTEHNARVRMGG